MAIEKTDITLPVRRFIQFSICKSHKFIQDYPHAFIIFIILFLLHKLFPSLFLLCLSYSPVFALTSILLGAILYYGEKEPNLHEIKERENTSQINTECKSIEDTLYLSLANTSSSDSESDEKSEKRPNSNEEIKELEINSHRISSDSESNEKSENNISQNRSCETERFKRLTSLIERRKARMSLRHSIKRSLKDPDFETLMDDSTCFRVRVSPITTPKWNPNDDSGTRYQSSDQKEGFMPVPGSAPSVLLHRSPFEPGWNRNGLMGQKRVSRLDPFLVTEMDKESSENGCERRLNDFSDDLSMNESDENVLDLKNEYSTVEMKPGESEFNDGISIAESEEETFFTRDLEQNSANMEEENANSYSDTILLSEFLKLCSSQKAQPIKDQSQIEPESPSEFLNLCSSEIPQPIKDQIETEHETPSETTETLIGKEIVENAPDQFSSAKTETVISTIEQIQIKENEVSELESAKGINSILKQIRAENGSVSKGKDESGSIETGQVGQTGLSKSEMVIYKHNGYLKDETALVLEEMAQSYEQAENVSVLKKNDEFTSVETGKIDELNSVETGQKDEFNSVRTGQMGRTGLSESETEISEQNGNLIDESGLILEERGRICEGGLKILPFSDSISSNLKKLRKQNKAAETSSSSSNSD